MLPGVPVLLCLDLQQEFVAQGRPWADPDGDCVAATCARIIAGARDSGWSLVHTHLYQGAPMIAGHGLTQPIPGCEPRPGEVLLRRAGVSAYAHPDLEGLLEGWGGRAYLIGFSAPMSLTATLFDSSDRGHGLTLIEEAVGAADVGEWGAEHTRALCIDTARKMDRAIRLNDVEGLSLPAPVSAGGLRIA
ncbi:cysteine hydrolase [Alkalicaulis satelles]|uniref:Cysteine hydrolase n=1 Tax=Alkalicaulis satelles TaxID=2609175 RepID=A0A5M6Z8R8_9PROT|nr:isochorismatase family protein [Alkalicaulis satelles]KAA5801042.1 cysteine hydrolase [Alkalicaulis satelles]